MLFLLKKEGLEKATAMEYLTTLYNSELFSAYEVKANTSVGAVGNKGLSINVEN